MTFDPTSVEVLCVTLPKDHCVQVPWKYIKVCGYSDLFCKNLKRRSLTPRWPLTPHLLRSHVWLYPRIIVSKSNEHTWNYVDTVTFFAKKTWTKGHWPLDDLWPHICWGHMCDSTQGSLCPSPMNIHESMWIQWPFLPKKTWTKGHWPLDDLWPHICWGHMRDSSQGSLCPSSMGIHQCMWIQSVIDFAKITTYIHTYTYYIHILYIHNTTYRISDHIVSFWTTFRRDNNNNNNLQFL